ncbi:MAG: DUF5627 domain-containing protein [Breznakibacter sp.]
MKKTLFILPFLLMAFASCQNQDWEFSDYDYQTVYFAYQYPVRTITLGEDIYDTSLDNEHKCKIMATTGGVRENNRNIVIDIQVDNSLCDGLLFEAGGDNVVAMPGNYYTLASNQITISKGSLSGGVEVQLSDAFFADPLALRNTYVIPLVMTNVVNADSILSGTPAIDNPVRTVAGGWNVVPKDYILYAIKYINPWHGYYLRRGKDIVTGKNGNTSLDQTIVRHEEYVELDEVCELTTRSLTGVEFPVTLNNSAGTATVVTMLLTFDDSGNCTISSGSEGYAISGSGKFVTDGEKNSWGNVDRDGMYLQYTVDFGDMTVTTQDTLVVRNRGVVMEVFSPVQE